MNESVLAIGFFVLGRIYRKYFSNPRFFSFRGGLPNAKSAYGFRFRREADDLGKTGETGIVSTNAFSCGTSVAWRDISLTQSARLSGLLRIKFDA